MMRLARAAFPLLATALLLAGCLQPAEDGSGGPDGSGSESGAQVPTSPPKLDAATVLDSLREFASAYPERHDNLPGHEGARQWILSQWEAAGLTTFRQDFSNGIDQANLIGIKWGEVRDEWVVVGGHYDTTHDDCIATGEAGSDACPAHALSGGTYDDGSGTILTVELGKLWADLPSRYTIAFVAYDGEERGLQGASFFVDNATSGPVGPFGPITIRGALDLDMFGITWPGTAAPTQILDNSAALHQVFQEARQAMGMPDDMYFCGDQVTLGSSDFQAYFDHEIPVVFFSSDFGKYTPPGSPATTPQAVYPNWHLVDTYETMEANAGGPDELLAGFQTASDLAAAELHAMADTTLELDVHAPVTGPC